MNDFYPRAGPEPYGRARSLSSFPESLAELQSYFPDFEQVLPEFWT